MPRRSLQFFIRRFFGRHEIEHDLNAELQAHLTMDVQQRMDRGMTPEAAREAAAREFGNVGVVSEVTRDMWGFAWLEQGIQDAVYAGRMLRKAPLLSAVVALTLALGIGSTTAIFTLVHGILLRPLPFPSSERLALIWELSPQTKKTNVVALNNYVAWKERGHSFESMAAFFALPMNLVGAEESEQVPGLKVTSEFFATLGTPPLLGRTFRPGEYDRDEPRDVVLSYGAWQRRFGSRPDAVGKKIAVNGQLSEIIGVMPPGSGSRM